MSSKKRLVAIKYYKGFNAKCSHVKKRVEKENI